MRAWNRKKTSAIQPKKYRYPALIAIYTVFNLPFVIWLMRSYFDGVPRDVRSRRANWSVL